MSQFEPAVESWGRLLDGALHDAPQAGVLNNSLQQWRDLTRVELGLPAGMRVIAAGHEPVLWHPGILAKYLAMTAWAELIGAACLHVEVDQHTGGFGAVDVPVFADDGSLRIDTVQLGEVNDEVPMGWHPPIDPPAIHEPIRAALPSIEMGFERICALLRTYRTAANAAEQFRQVLNELLGPWLPPIPNVTASRLMTTSLARALVKNMVNNPAPSVNAYNQAVASVPDAGIGPLATSTGDFELPLWRIDDQGRRLRAMRSDAKAWLDAPSKVTLLPRALFMTALLRLGVCDVFIHGFGGARYDPAMERWVKSWLGVAPQPSVMVTATLHLPLHGEQHQPLDLHKETQTLRRLLHDPDTAVGSSNPSESKRMMLEKIKAAPRNSLERRQLYTAMHEAGLRLREQRTREINDAQARIELARRQLAERAILDRRTWPFPFYPQGALAALAQEIRQQFVHVHAAAAPAATASSTGR